MEDIRNGKLEILRIGVTRRKMVTEGSYYCPDRRCDAFLFILAGSMDVSFEGSVTFHFQEGVFGYLPLHSKFHLHVPSNKILYYICDFKGYPDAPRIPFAFTPPDFCWYERHFYSLGQKCDSLSKSRYAASMSLLYQIYAKVLGDITNDYTPLSVRDKVNELCIYIRNNITDAGLSVAQIAKHANISEVHLRRLFQAVNGCSPSKYITNARILHAKSLMEDPKLTLQEIAEQSGYSSFTYFSTAFKNATGITPSQYRDNI